MKTPASFRALRLGSRLAAALSSTAAVSSVALAHVGPESRGSVAESSPASSAEQATGSRPQTNAAPPPSSAGGAEGGAAVHAAAASTPVYRADGGSVSLQQGEAWLPVVTTVGATSVRYHEGLLYVTHGDSTISVYDCADAERPSLVRRLVTGRGVATDVQIIDGKPWVVTVTRQALPLGELATSGDSNTPGAVPSARPTKPAEGAAASTAGEGRVSVVEPGVIEIAADFGSDVRIGDRFVIYRETSVAGMDGTFAGEEQVAMAEVFAVRPDSALAEVSRSAVARENDVARRALAEQSESNVYPIRVPHVGEVGGTLRPIVNAGSPLGVGVLADVYATYWGKSYFINLAVQPLGLGWTDDGNIVSTSALLEGGYDARAFSVGLGIGVSAINGDMDEMLESFGFTSADALGEETTRVERQQTHAALTLSQRVRLGALDGLNLTLRNLLLLHEDSSTNETGFIYGGTLGKLTVPVDRRNDLFIEGGGGVMGYWLVGAGVGTWITGNGSPGSWKLSISAGAAGIWGTKETTITNSNSSYTSHQDVEIAGPMVSVGVSRRVGF